MKICIKSQFTDKCGLIWKFSRAGYKNGFDQKARTGNK